MSDEGEKTCPLCAEEMDMTDQQLKPCRCGYEVCVWCWHHIMEMAEKVETEGRCPACRTPYDKEKIVGTAANCERLVAEVSMEKKHKSQKAKSKTSENRKQLTSVRVIQRNLVYIVGLPLNLADEDLLQRKEYFGQYGKVLKVSISRTSAGTIQQFPNNTCSVYITYAREDEALRCIQSVHAFILDDRPLRACFGTTKYCHAWLRNVPCSNPDCLYLHEVGSQDDSFTKDEFNSAYSRVQEITGITNNVQQRSGNVLPPPADDYCNSTFVTGISEIKSSLNNSASNARGSPPSTSSGRAGGLPLAASWGSRASNSIPPARSIASANGPTKQKAETTDGVPVIASVVSGSPQVSVLPNGTSKRHVSNEETPTRHNKSKREASYTVKQHARLNSNGIALEASSSTAPAALAVKSRSQTPCLAEDCNQREGTGREVSMPLNTRCLVDERPSPSEHRGGSSVADVNIQKLGVGVSSIFIDKPPNSVSEVLRPDGLTLDTFISHSGHNLQRHDCEESQAHSAAAGKASATVVSLSDTSESCNFPADVQTPATHNLTFETEDDFDNQRLKDAIVSQACVSASSLHHMSSHLMTPLQPQANADCTGNYTVNHPTVLGSDEGLGINMPSASVSSNGFLEHLMNRASGQGSSLLNCVQGNHLGQFYGDVAHVDSRPGSDMGESHIISNILSLDLDSWDDSLTSQHLAKFFGENEKQDRSFQSANSWKNQTSDQSRFSFARQEDSRNPLLDIQPPLSSISYTTDNPSFDQGFVENRNPYLDKLGNGFGLHHHNVELSNNYLCGHGALSSVSRSQISAPPGFTAPSRPPPPGFSSHERSDQSVDFLKSGYQSHEASSFLRNPYQPSPSGNTSTVNDIEFIDPAILAVGKGRLPAGVNSSAIDMRPNFHVQAPMFENEFRHQSLLQRSYSPHQVRRYSDVRDNFSSPNDAYVLSSRHLEQSQANNTPYSHFSHQPPRNTVVSNGQWDGWSELQSPNDMGMTELFRNDRSGSDNFYGGYESSKYQMRNSGDMYNRSFGM